MNKEEEDLKTLERLEQRLYEGLGTSNADILGEVFSDDVVYMHSQGVAESKEDNLTGQRDGLFLHGKVVRRNGGTVVYGGMAVTSGLIDMIDLAHGPAYTLHLEQTLVWGNEQGTWRLLVRMATRVKE